MRKLYLIRHAEAEKNAKSGPDKSRELTEFGKSQIRELAQKIENLPRPEIVLCSDATRTEQTCAILFNSLDIEPEIKYESGLYYSDVATYLDQIRQVDNDYKCLVVIGHNPIIHSLALELSARGDIDDLLKLESSFPPASCALLALDIKSWSEAKEKTGRLEFLF